MSLICGGLLAYAGFGAVTGSLYIPSRRGPGTMLSGAPAWSVTTGVALICFGIAVREGFWNLQQRRRTAIELASVGIGLLLAMAGPLLFS
jgi:hypothetical protein